MSKREREKESGTMNRARVRERRIARAIYWSWKEAASPHGYLALQGQDISIPTVVGHRRGTAHEEGKSAATTTTTARRNATHVYM